jgi:hypothetical protein
VKNVKHSSRLLLACKHVDRFSLQWTHFFMVVEFAMDIGPEWPRTVWAAIRLIFVVSVPLYYGADFFIEFPTAMQGLCENV